MKGQNPVITMQLQAIFRHNDSILCFQNEKVKMSTLRTFLRSNRKLEETEAIILQILSGKYGVGQLPKHTLSLPLNVVLCI